MMQIGVKQAAIRLGVSEQRIRALIAKGDLAASRVGRVYLLDPVDVARHAEAQHPPGPRLSPPDAWGVISLAANEGAPWLARRARYRLKSLLAERGFSGLIPRLGRRGQVLRFRAHPSELEDLRHDRDLVLSGASAASDLRLGLLAFEMVDGYVAESRMPELLRRYHLKESRDPNVVLRSAPDGVLPSGRYAPLPAIVADLMDDPDPRCRQLARDLLAEIGREPSEA